MNANVHTDTTGTMKLTPTGTGLKLEQGGISLDGTAPVAGQITGGVVVSTASQLTSPTITTPTIISPAVTGNATTGVVVSKSVRFVEAAAATSYTGTIPIPAGATLHSVKVIAEALWDGTSASMNVGDTADPDGYFATINLKATDLEVGEILDTSQSTLWGGQEGAYLVAASGRRGPVADNFGMYYAAGSNILAVVTPGAADGSAGRTVVVVTYSVGAAIAPVVV